MTRRVLLGTGVAVVAAAGALAGADRLGRLDDLADAVGLEPKPLPDPADTRIVRAAARDLAALVAVTEATDVAHPPLGLAALVAIGREHLDTVGGAVAVTDVGAPSPDRATAATALAEAYRAASTARAAQSVDAASPALVRVLASMSASHAQGARFVAGAA